MPRKVVAKQQRSPAPSQFLTSLWVFYTGAIGYIVLIQYIWNRCITTSLSVVQNVKLLFLLRLSASTTALQKLSLGSYTKFKSMLLRFSGISSSNKGLSSACSLWSASIRYVQRNLLILVTLGPFSGHHEQVDLCRIGTKRSDHEIIIIQEVAALNSGHVPKTGFTVHTIKCRFPPRSSILDTWTRPTSRHIG